jgi:hypothetical protein
MIPMAVRWNKTAVVEVHEGRRRTLECGGVCIAVTPEETGAKSREALAQHGTLFPFHAVSSTQHMVGDAP